MNTDKIIAEKIASEYASKKTSKVVALKKLDRKAKQTAEIFAYTFGIIIGLIGIFGVSINYFIYKKLIAKGKEKYGSDISRLAKEIVNE